ncbi:hypothetical protein SeMB42_g04175 [Synchytrium endobioticum]|uniref:Uncharacterized protein n=1 Tax=Synchytrium endobioticum TaxID=286115 RepID=A0A507D0I6_9FUNG|nr:hypothetical protein SeMB42_g04175 [Synchytrium endobioticum]
MRSSIRIPFPMTCLTIDNLENNNPGTRIYCNEKDRLSWSQEWSILLAYAAVVQSSTLCHDEVKFSLWNQQWREIVTVLMIQRSKLTCASV